MQGSSSFSDFLARLQTVRSALSMWAMKIKFRMSLVMITAFQFHILIQPFNLELISTDQNSIPNSHIIRIYIPYSIYYIYRVIL